MRFDQLQAEGIGHCRRGDFQAGIAAFAAALELAPQSVDAMANLGIAFQGVGAHAQALANFERVTWLRPTPQIHTYRGLSLLALRHFEEAIKAFDTAVNANALFYDAHFNKGNALSALSRFDDALISYDIALRLRPNSELAHSNRGAMLCKLRRYRESLECFDQALRINPQSLDAAFNKALALQSLRQFAEALVIHDRIAAVRPSYPRLFVHRAHCLRALDRMDQALASCDRALSFNPLDVKAHVGKGDTLQAMLRRDPALLCYREALRIDRNHPYSAGLEFAASLGCCDWTNYQSKLQSLTQAVRDGQRVVYPWDFATQSDSAADQLLCARVFASDKCPSAGARPATGRLHRDRIHVAYLSSDFHDHATVCLIAGLFERHDRARFEITAVSFTPNRPSAMRARVELAFDRFIDVSAHDDETVVALLRKLNVDIVVDLKGYTGDCRPGILALRPADIQVNYLGYPGTMGVDFVDYLLADPVLIPPEHRHHYSEQIVYLPDSYQVNDDARVIGADTPTRSAVGLPENGFAFCSFNNNYKITPVVFDIWMRLLAQVPDSVLWLYRGNDAVVANLRREARQRNVDPERLVFAPRVAVDEHLARHRLADLFLDNLPCNAHTTGSDALRAGLPMVTCLGTTFAGRVGASLLHAVGLPELVTASLEEYEALALRLARDRIEHARIKHKLSHNLPTAPLFDTDRFRRNLEQAYAHMVQRAVAGDAPASFAVRPA